VKGAEIDAHEAVFRINYAPISGPASTGYGADQGSGSRVQGSGFRVWGLGFRVQGSGFRVEALKA
jgi:hypothetical protein